MGHWAKVVSGSVVQVIVAEPDFFDTFVDSTPGEWIQTSYNTYAGQHLLGGVPLRKNYANIGYTYDRQRDAFIPPRPYASWSLDDATCTWVPPKPRPNDGKGYAWDESAQKWLLAPPNGS